MILTVCPNTALDKIIFIKKWTHGFPMRTNKMVTSVGGKGLNASVTLSQLKVNTIALGFFEGKIGIELIELLQEYKIIPEPVWVGGNNRISYVIAEEETNIHSHIIVGELEINSNQVHEFISRYNSRLLEARFVIFAGTIPPSLPDDFYCEMIRLANQVGVPTLIDTQKQFMLHALKAKPDIVKMNKEEFGWTFSHDVVTFQELIQRAKEVRIANDIKNLVITLAKDGILAFTTDGNFLAKAPVQKAVNAAGAGDSVSAALAWRLSLGKDWKDALLWSSAVSAASVLTPRTGDIRLIDVNRILKEVELIQID